MNAYETAQALINGYLKEFTYNNRIFKVGVNNHHVIITDILTDYKAVSPRQSEWNMIDFQGTAACLVKEKRHLVFDKEGNIVK